MVEFTVAFEDASGAPAQPPGAVSWTSASGSIATIQPSVDEDTVATVTAVAEGDSEMTATSGGISASYDITVSEAPATQATITAGDPFETTQAPAKT